MPRFKSTAKCTLYLLFLLTGSLARADQSLIQLAAFPSISVADGHSTIDISATVRDSAGHLAPDGTQITFTTTIGTFRQFTVPTVSGTAHASLVAGTNAGMANISATSSLGGSPSTLTYQFVGSKAELSSAREYVEIVAPAYMQYAHAVRVIAAAAPNKGVSLRYRDIEIQADDLQYDINAYAVKARKAVLKIGKGFVKTFDELNITLNSHHGYGTTTYKWRDVGTYEQRGNSLEFLAKAADGTWQLPPETDHYGLVEFNRDVLTPCTQGIPPAVFEFADLSNSPSTVSARKAVIFPRKGIQFQSAEIYVANAKIIHLPYFVVDFTITNGPIVTDGLVSINNSQIGINYPQYLMLRPGITSDFRFHMGDQYGRGFSSDRGAFLDYELNWDHGDDMQGGLTFGGIGRNDWEVDAHQFWRFDDRTSASMQFALPSGTGLFGSGNISHEFTGFSADLNASHSQTFSGFISSAQTYAMDLTTDPRKVSGMPVRLSYGLTATHTSSDDEVLGSRQQAGEGLIARASSDAIPVDKHSMLTASLTATKLFGENELPGIGLLGTLNVNRQFGRTANMMATYNYTQDGFNDKLLGRHLISLQGNYHTGKIEFTGLGSRGIGVDRLSLFADMSYRLSGLWRLGYNYTYDHILGTEFLDYDFSLNYRIGWREVGIMWSQRTKRFGLLLLGNSF